MEVPSFLLLLLILFLSCCYYCAYSGFAYGTFQAGVHNKIRWLQMHIGAGESCSDARAGVKAREKLLLAVSVYSLLRLPSRLAMKKTPPYW